MNAFRIWFIAPSVISPAMIRRREQDVRKYDVSLQIDDPADIEIHEVQIEPEVIRANVAKQHA